MECFFSSSSNWDSDFIVLTDGLANVKFSKSDRISIDRKVVEIDFVGFRRREGIIDMVSFVLLL